VTSEKQKVVDISQEREHEFKNLTEEITTYKKIIENYEIEIMERKGQQSTCESMITELTRQLEKSNLEIDQKTRQYGNLRPVPSNIFLRPGY
jgi:predicted  nucleic acid-binding Zn-ribbon protein